MSSSCTLGVDVSKRTLEVASWPAERRWEVPNSPEGHSQLRQIAEDIEAQLIVLEATGGLEEACAESLCSAGLSVEVVNPRQARSFATATGRLEKTDRIDAVGLAHFAQIVEPGSFEVSTVTRKKLKGLVRRREQLIEMRSAEKTRLHRASDEVVISSIEASIERLTQAIDRLDDQVEELVGSDLLDGEFAILTSTPGVGQRTATRLMANLPELGQLNRKEVAKLGGLAPLCNDSGQKQGNRACRGGRPRIRHTMYLAAMVAIRCCDPINQFYNRLRDRGKEAKVAMIACARKLLTILNSMLKNGTTFDAKKALPNEC